MKTGFLKHKDAVMRELDTLFEEFLFDTLQGTRLLAQESVRKFDEFSNRKSDEDDKQYNKRILNSSEYKNLWFFYFIYNYFQKGVFWKVGNNKKIEVHNKRISEYIFDNSLIFNFDRLFGDDYHNMISELIDDLRKCKDFNEIYDNFSVFAKNFRLDFERTCIYREVYLGKQWEKPEIGKIVKSNKKRILNGASEPNDSIISSQSKVSNFSIHADVCLITGKLLFLIEFKLHSTSQYIEGTILKKISLLVKKFLSGRRGGGEYSLNSMGMNSVPIMVIISDDRGRKSMENLEGIRNNIQEEISKCTSEIDGFSFSVYFIKAGSILRSYYNVTCSLLKMRGESYAGMENDLAIVDNNIEQIARKLPPENDSFVYRENDSFAYSELDDELRNIRSSINKVRYVSALYGQAAPVLGREQIGEANFVKDSPGVDEKDLVTSNVSGWSYGYYNLIINKNDYVDRIKRSKNSDELPSSQSFAKYITDKQMFKDAIVVMVDLTRFTEYSRRTKDIDFLRACLLSFYSASRSAVMSNRGYLYRFVGDQVIAFFGVPEHRKVDNYAAVQCALELLEIGDSTMNRWRRHINTAIDEDDTDRGVKCGISMGTINVLPLRPFSQTHQTFSGDVINDCSRALSAAETGEICITQTFYNALNPCEDYLSLLPIGRGGKGAKEELVDLFLLEKLRYNKRNEAAKKIPATEKDTKTAAILPDENNDEEPRKSKLLDCRFAVQDLYTFVK